MNILLQELIDTSPLIAEHISGMRSSLSSETVAAITEQSLIIESIEILINELKNQGIVFYVDHDELMSDFYNAKFIIALYQQFNPTALMYRLKNDQALYKNICASVDDVSETEVLTHILESIQNHDQLEFSRDMYVFLHDKVLNTSKYSAEIERILARISQQLVSDELPVITTRTVEFLAKLVDERKKYKTLLNKLFEENSLKLNIIDSLKLAEVFRSELCTNDVVTILSDYRELNKHNPKLIASVIDRIKHNSKLYVGFYSNDELSLISMDLKIGIIMTQLSNSTLFEIESDFKALTEADSNIPTLVAIIKKQSIF